MTATPRTAARTSVKSGRKARKLAAAALGALAAAAAVTAATAAAAAPQAQAATLTGCVAAPSACGFPDATSTGVPAGTVLKNVPSQVSSGPGWAWNASAGKVLVTGDGAVLSGLNIPGNLEIQADNVTVKNVKVTASGNYGIDLRHTTGVTITSSEVSGKDAGAGRLNYAIDDVYGDSAGTTVTGTDIAYYRTGIQLSNGTATGNFIHDPGYVTGDHTNGFYAAGGTTDKTLLISGNTILNGLGQTDAINLDAMTSGVPTANMTVKGNLLSGGSYTIYAGATLGNTTSNIVIQNNRFAQNYFPKGGQYGHVTYFDPNGAGNTWTGNVFDSTGQTAPSK